MERVVLLCRRQASARATGNSCMQCTSVVHVRKPTCKRAPRFSFAHACTHARVRVSACTPVQYRLHGAVFEEGRPGAPRRAVPSLGQSQPTPVSIAEAWKGRVDKEERRCRVDCQGHLNPPRHPSDAVRANARCACTQWCMHTCMPVRARSQIHAHPRRCSFSCDGCMHIVRACMHMQYIFVVPTVPAADGADPTALQPYGHALCATTHAHMAPGQCPIGHGARGVPWQRPLAYG